MNTTTTDNGLLLGLLAAHLGLIDRAALLDGLRAWSRQRDRDLGELLVERGLLTEPRRRGVEDILARHAALGPAALVEWLNDAADPVQTAVIVTPYPARWMEVAAQPQLARRSWRRWAAVAAALVFAVGAGFGLGSIWRGSPAPTVAADQAASDALQQAEAKILLGHRYVKSSEPRQALAHFARAVAALDALDGDAGPTPATRRLRIEAAAQSAHVHSACGSHWQAAEQWKAAAEACESADRVTLLLNRSRSVAHSGGHAFAAHLVREALAGQAATPDWLHRAGVTLAVSSAGIARSRLRPLAVRERQSELYAADAMRMFRRAAAAELYATPQAARALRDEPELESLRKRDDFHQLLNRLGAS